MQNFIAENPVFRYYSIVYKDKDNNLKKTLHPKPTDQ